MDKKLKQALIIVAFGVGLFVALMNLGVVWQFIKNIFSMFLPILAGLIVAFILSVPMKGFENLIKKLFKKSKYEPKGKVLHLAGFFLTLIS